MAVKDRGSALEGFNAVYDGTGNADAWVSSTIKCRVNVGYELVRTWQTAMRATRRNPKLQGKPLGLLPELYPFDQLKRPLVDEANEFVRQIGLHHWEPLTSIYAFKVWGPYAEKVGVSHDWVPEADNPFIPEHEKQVATTAWLYGGNESPIVHGCAFFLVGEFVRAAQYGHIDEGRGLILV